MSISLRNLTNDFLAWGEKSLAPGTVANYRRILERFNSSTGDVAAGDLRKHILVTWGTTWHDIQAVQRLYNWAVEDAEVLERNPFRRVKRPPLGQRKRTLDRATLAKICRRSTRPFRRYLLALRETIARPQEVRAFTWENLQFPDKPRQMEAALTSGNAVFVLEEYKGRRRRSDPTVDRVIPVSPRLGRLLWRLYCLNPQATGPIFINSQGRAWTNNAVRCRIRWIRRKLGIVRDHRGETVCAYTIRHTMATAAAAAGIRDRLLADIMGHTSTRTTARYQHLQVGHLQEALKKLRRRRSA